MAVLVEGGDPAAGAFGHLVEVVGGEVTAQRVRTVDGAGLGDRDPGQGPLVTEVPCLVGRGQDAGALALGYGDVGPPVDGCGVFVRVAYPYADVQEVGVLGQPEVHLERQVAQPLPLPEADHFAAVGCGHPGGVDRGAGQCGVARGTDVPFDAAGEPGAVEREVGGLQDGVGVEEFTAGRLVVEGVDAAAEPGQDGGPQPVVLDDDRVQSGGDAFAPVPVEDADREHGGQWFVADLACHVTWQSGPVAVVDDMHLVERPQCGQRVLRAQWCGRQSQYGASYGRGQGNLAPSHGPPQVRAPPMTMEHAGQRPGQGRRRQTSAKDHGGDGRGRPPGNDPGPPPPR